MDKRAFRTRRRGQMKNPRACARCRFPNLPIGKRRQKVCDPCLEAILDIYEEQGGANRAARAAAKYGIEQERFFRLLMEQGGRCAICDRDQTLVVDHDHVTEEVRGLLCAKCNTAIGLLSESPKVIEAAGRYLSEHNVRRAAVLDAKDHT